MSDVARANGDHTAGHIALRGEATWGATAAQSAQWEHCTTNSAPTQELCLASTGCEAGWAPPCGPSPQEAQQTPNSLYIAIWALSAGLAQASLPTRGRRPLHALAVLLAFIAIATHLAGPEATSSLTLAVSPFP